MFGIGIGELILIAIVALILVGPKKLPDLMRQGGKFFVQLRRTAHDVKSTFDDVIREAENELRQEELSQLRQVLNKQEQEIKAIDVTAKEANHSLSPFGAVNMNHHDPHHDPHHLDEYHRALNEGKQGISKIAADSSQVDRLGVQNTQGGRNIEIEGVSVGDSSKPLDLISRELDKKKN